MKFGEFLKLFRKRAGLTQVELAEAAGTTQQAISKLESGEVQNPEMDTVLMLAKALKKTPNELFGIIQRKVG